MNRWLKIFLALTFVVMGWQANASTPAPKKPEKAQTANNITPTMVVQTQAPIKPKYVGLVASLQEILKLTMPDANIKVENLELDYEDTLISILKRLPPYTMQYIAPALYHATYMSEKVLNLPEVKKWKGKYPTRIAPQMQDYAKHYLKDMSPELYFLLMPEAWPSEPQNKEEPNKQKISRTFNLDSPKDRDLFLKINPRPSLLDGVQYPSSKAFKDGSYLKLDTERTKNPTATSPLKGGDVIAIANSTMALRDFATPEHLNKIRDLAMIDNSTLSDLVNPCHAIVDRVKRAGLETEFTAHISKENYNADTWAMECDKTVKAYRVAHLNYSTAFILRGWREQKQQLARNYGLTDDEKAKTTSYMNVFLDMYTAPEVNRSAVFPYQENVRKAFNTPNMMFLETPFYGF